MGLACDSAERLAVEAGWSEADVTRLVLALGEAVGNAVEHSTGDGLIRLSVMVQRGHIDIVVDDGGSGPVAEKLQSAALPESLSATSGRGLFMIRELSDDVFVDEGGALRLGFDQTS